MEVVYLREFFFHGIEKSRVSYLGKFTHIMFLGREPRPQRSFLPGAII